MKQKSASQYISSNDFEGAAERLESANGRWQGHWFNVCQTIMNNCKEWAKKYILDPITKTVRTIGEMVKKKQPKNVSQESYTYLIKLFDEAGNWVYTKIGKANNVKQRMNQIRKEKYLGGNGSVEIIKTYTLPNDDLAQVLESFMRGFFRKTRELIPNDRFEPFDPSEEDFAVFEQYYQITLANA